MSLLKQCPITEIMVWENILKQYQGLLVCYADNPEKYYIYSPIIKHLNRGVVVICDFPIDKISEVDNSILVEVENPNYEILLRLLHILMPKKILLWDYDKKNVSLWKNAIDTYNAPFIYLEDITDQTMLVEVCKKINEQLWNDDFNRDSNILGLHIGCGSQPISGWINVDLKYKYPYIGYMDASLPFPYPDGSFKHIFSEHMFEHLPFEAGIHMLKEAYRTLRDGGLLVLTIPTLDFLIKIYTDPDNELHKQYINWSISRYDPFVSKFYSDEKIPSMFIINNFMRFWNHQMIYDCDTLSSLLYRVGFHNVACIDVEKFHFQGHILEKHGNVIPDWANRLESKTFVAYK